MVSTEYYYKSETSLDNTLITNSCIYGDYNVFTQNDLIFVVDFEN